MEPHVPGPGLPNPAPKKVATCQAQKVLLPALGIGDSLVRLAPIIFAVSGRYIQPGVWMRRFSVGNHDIYVRFQVRTKVTSYRKPRGWVPKSCASLRIERSWARN